MEIIGIVTEYNPFHLGHAHQIKRVRKICPDALIVAAMSGSFTQRGEPALFDKWRRARFACLGGADLILELPFPFAAASAEHFARGAVALLSRLGVVDRLAFGAETGDAARLLSLAERIDASATQSALHERIQAGESYARALSEALPEDAELLHSPNAILAVEYLRALAGTKIAPLLIKREGAEYLEESLGAALPSATAIRRAAAQGTLAESALAKYFPEEILAALPPLPWRAPTLAPLYGALRLMLLRRSTEELRRTHGMDEGLEGRLRRAASAQSFEDFLAAAASRRYQKSRLSRLALYLLMDISRELFAACQRSGPLYARVLAASPRGLPLLKEIKARSALPLITKVSAHLTTRERERGLAALPPLAQMLALDTYATELRNIITGEANAKNDFQTSPIFLKNCP